MAGWTVSAAQSEPEALARSSHHPAEAPLLSVQPKAKAKKEAAPKKASPSPPRNRPPSASGKPPAAAAGDKAKKKKGKKKKAVEVVVEEVVEEAPPPSSDEEDVYTDVDVTKQPLVMFILPTTSDTCDAHTAADAVAKLGETIRFEIPSRDSQEEVRTCGLQSCEICWRLRWKLELTYRP
jgi:hypothetical protein